MPFLTMNSITTADGATVLVRYIFEDNTDAAPSEVISGVKGAAYSVTPPAVTGYTPNPAQLTGNFVANPAVEDYFDAVKNIIYTAVATKYPTEMTTHNITFGRTAVISLSGDRNTAGPTGTVALSMTSGGVTYEATVPVVGTAGGKAEAYYDTSDTTLPLYSALAAAGTHRVTATYSGDTYHEPCSGRFTVTTRSLEA